MIDPKSLIEAFQLHGGNAEKAHFYFSPGRVNLIGEHIDYNGGLVMPAAISLGITALFQPDGSRSLRIVAADFEEERTIDLDSLFAPNGTSRWPLYIVGTLRIVAAKGLPLKGGLLYLKSDLPLGSGLSSSAAMECLVAYIMGEAFYEEERVQLALDAQQAEREEVGVNCGIMDQFAVAMGKKDHAILLDCSSLEYKHIPIALGDISLVIINSNHPRTLADSKYNERRAECDAALKSVQGFDPAQFLVDVHELSVTQILDDTLYLRAKHVVTEQKRVIAAAEALALGDVKYFGNLLWASHQSLDADYEVAGDALNTIIYYANKFTGCIGARMTGAGFGGCAIALVETEKVKRFCDYVGQKFEQKTGVKADFYIAEITDGVRRL